MEKRTLIRIKDIDVGKLPDKDLGDMAGASNLLGALLAPDAQNPARMLEHIDELMVGSPNFDQEVVAAFREKVANYYNESTRPTSGDNETITLDQISEIPELVEKRKTLDRIFALFRPYITTTRAAIFAVLPDECLTSGLAQTRRENKNGLELDETPIDQAIRITIADYKRFVAEVEGDTAKEAGQSRIVANVQALCRRFMSDSVLWEFNDKWSGAEEDREKISAELSAGMQKTLAGKIEEAMKAVQELQELLAGGDAPRFEVREIEVGGRPVYWIYAGQDCELVVDKEALEKLKQGELVEIANSRGETTRGDRIIVNLELRLGHARHRIAEMKRRLGI